MLKQTLRLVFYLFISFLIGIIVTLAIDQYENIAVEKNLRHDIEQEIRNTVESFTSSVSRPDPAKTIMFIRKFTASSLKDRVMATEPSREPSPDPRDFKFLFALTTSAGKINFYLRNSFLEDELAILDRTELIYGIITTIVVFTFMVLYSEKRRKTALIHLKLEKKHAEYKKALEEHEALALLGRMAATLAHELKTPIATISNLVQVLPARLGDENFTKRFISLTGQELKRTQQLIDNMLVYGKDIVVTKEKWLDFSRFVSGLAVNNGIKLIGCPAFKIYCDDFYMRLLLDNLLRNSRTAGADAWSVRLNQLRGQGLAEILIEDNGQGIPEGISLDELFAPFITHRSSGAGVGLYLAKKIVEAHGGDISLSRLKTGAGVTIHFPDKKVKIDGQTV
ncbi:MAG: HAMP domain-containing sensor histidine kinase [Nitrospirota bacterium]